MESRWGFRWQMVYNGHESILFERGLTYGRMYSLRREARILASLDPTTETTITWWKEANEHCQ